jgi:hypothetical protein
MKRVVMCVALGCALLMAVGTEVGATVVVALGTAERAKAWSGACGSLAAPVLQLGESIGLGGGLLRAVGRCQVTGGLVVTEYFYVPEGATNLRLRIEDFELFGKGELRLNGRVVAFDEDGREDGEKDRDREEEERGSASRGLLAGTTNSLSIAFGGGVPGGLAGGGIALLQASLIYDAPVVPPSGGPVIGPVTSAAAVPEPSSVVLMGAALGGLALVARRRAVAVRGGHK